MRFQALTLPRELKTTCGDLCRKRVWRTRRKGRSQEVRRKRHTALPVLRAGRLVQPRMAVFSGRKFFFVRRWRGVWVWREVRR